MSAVWFVLYILHNIYIHVYILYQYVCVCVRGQRAQLVVTLYMCAYDDYAARGMEMCSAMAIARRVRSAQLCRRLSSAEPFSQDTLGDLQTSIWHTVCMRVCVCFCVFGVPKRSAQLK